MSKYPFYFEYEHPTPRSRRLLDQFFGLGLTPQDNVTIIAIPQNEYIRTLRNLRSTAKEVGSTIKEDKDMFQVNLDVQHFAPEEISVKTVDGCLIVEAKHEERKDDHGFISRGFTRRYPLPDGVEADLVMSKLSSDGVLSITAPLKAPPKTANERVVPIIQTGPVKKQVEGNAEESSQK